MRGVPAGSLTLGGLRPGSVYVVLPGADTLCSKCGFVGGRATGCGTAHPTQVKATDGQHDDDIEPRRERIRRVAAARSGQPPQLGMRASIPRPAPVAPEPEPEQDDADELGRWSASRIAEETARAESSKLSGELPVPRSTFEFGRGGAG